MDANLSDEEKEIVQQLVTQESVKAKYAWDENFQRRILGLALTDSEFLVQAVALIKPEYFSNEAHYLICKILFDAFEKGKTNTGRIHCKATSEGRDCNKGRCDQDLL